MKKILGLIICVFLLGICTYRVYLSYVQEQLFLSLYLAGEYEALVNQGYSGEDPVMLHNYGNAAFQSFSGSSYQNLGYLDQAVRAYSGSLQYQDHPLTKANYELSKELFDRLTERDNQQQQDQSGEGSQQSNSQSSGTQELGESESQSGQTPDTREQGYFLQDDQEINELSPEEQQELTQRLEQIQEEKLSNQRYYGKQQQESDLNNIFDSFFGNINRGGEKDW